jgi:hypothetical protein
MVGSVFKPEDQIQNAEVLWREARRDYESLSLNTANRREAIHALYRWHEAAQYYFSKCADEFLRTAAQTINSGDPTYAEKVLNELANNHRLLAKRRKTWKSLLRILFPRSSNLNSFRHVFLRKHHR